MCVDTFETVLMSPWSVCVEVYVSEMEMEVNITGISACIPHYSCVRLTDDWSSLGVGGGELVV